MAHKTLVGGTAYKVSGGKALVGGTAYKIAKGRALVGGTGYDISFMPSIGTPLNDMTWAQIRAISDAGLASAYFSVGDAKTIIINGTVGDTTFSNLSIDVFIIGIDHNSEVEGTNRIHFQIGRINGVNVALIDEYYGTRESSNGAFTMKTSSSNGSGGWESSHMRSTILGSDSDPTNPAANTLLSALPSDLRAVMKPVTKYTDNAGDSYGSTTAVTATTDYLPLLSEYEIKGTKNYVNKNEATYQAEYEYYAEDKTTRDKYKHSDTSTAVAFFLRSPFYNSGSNNGFCGYYSERSLPILTTSANYSYGVAPLFCV